jgi:hypothetical protein
VRLRDDTQLIEKRDCALQGKEVGVVVHHHRIVSEGGGGDKDVRCLSASPSADLPQGGPDGGHVLLSLLVEGQPEKRLAVDRTSVRNVRSFLLRALNRASSIVTTEEHNVPMTASRSTAVRTAGMNQYCDMTDWSTSYRGRAVGVVIDHGPSAAGSPSVRNGL